MCCANCRLNHSTAVCPCRHTYCIPLIFQILNKYVVSSVLCTVLKAIAKKKDVPPTPKLVKFIYCKQVVISSDSKLCLDTINIVVCIVHLEVISLYNSLI